MRYGSMLLDVQRPGRYEGVEAGAVVKEWAKVDVKVALAFPDTYEIGMSHLGLQILYEILNDLPWVAAERCYAPWPDMEALLREKGLPLLTRESGRSPNDFDLLGFTLQYELSATNVLTMLDLSGIPLNREARGEDAPIVMGGGPVASNPEPYADFFDAFFIGEAEEGIVEIAGVLREAKAKGLDRAARLRALRSVEGVYLPDEYLPIYDGGHFAGFATPEGGAPKKVRRRIVADLTKIPPPRRPMVPFGETVHERLAVEVTRGCTRGCRFCQAGYLYRPVREREPGALLSSIRDELAVTGHEEVGLLSLSTGDYSCIGPLTSNLISELSASHVSVSLPSLRIDGLDPRLAASIARVRKTGFTLAPEAGSERLRRAVNKDFGDDSIIEAIGRIFQAGWKSVKLYFMIGLPFETDEDRRAIVSLAKRIVGAAPGGKNRITVSVSNFVPKPHTPFQWAAQSSVEEIHQIQELLRREVPGKKCELKYHDARVSRVEGILARGDRRVGRLILAAWEKGCRMDGWSSEFSPARWEEAIAESGVPAGEYLGGRLPEEPLPWDMIEAGASREYLAREFSRAREAVATTDCRQGDCTGCGLCDFETIFPRTAKAPLAYPPEAEEKDEPDSEEVEGERLRFLYSKTGPASLLSHLETFRLLVRAFRAAGVKLLYSKGFNPHPKMQLGPALSLGTESLCETGEFKVSERPNLALSVEEINKNLPEGLRLGSIWLMSSGSRTLTGGGMEEEFFLTPSKSALLRLAGKEGWEPYISGYRKDPNLLIVKRRKNKPDRTMAAGDFILGLWPEGEGLCLKVMRHADGATLGPEAFVAALLGLAQGERALDRILKTKTVIY